MYLLNYRGQYVEFNVNWQQRLVSEFCRWQSDDLNFNKIKKLTNYPTDNGVLTINRPYIGGDDDFNFWVNHVTGDEILAPKALSRSWTLRLHSIGYFKKDKTPLLANKTVHLTIGGV